MLRLQASLQLLIMLTGNYGFFNLLTLVLIVNLLDDSYLEQVLRFNAVDDAKSGKVSQASCSLMCFCRLSCCIQKSMCTPNFVFEAGRPPPL